MRYGLCREICRQAYILITFDKCVNLWSSSSINIENILVISQNFFVLLYSKFFPTPDRGYSGFHHQRLVNLFVNFIWKAVHRMNALCVQLLYLSYIRQSFHRQINSLRQAQSSVLTTAGGHHPMCWRGQKFREGCFFSWTVTVTASCPWACHFQGLQHQHCPPAPASNTFHTFRIK